MWRMDVSGMLDLYVIVVWALAAVLYCRLP